MHVPLKGKTASRKLLVRLEGMKARGKRAALQSAWYFFRSLGKQSFLVVKITRLGAKAMF